jgi:hypothetical protein
MPWNFYGKPEWGQTVRYISVPPQPVTIDVPVSGDAGSTGSTAETQSQIVEIPGYIIVETTVGYLYPERWAIRQAGAGVFMWERVPSEFRKK